jgi:hypothetical protein
MGIEALVLLDEPGMGLALGMQPRTGLVRQWGKPNHDAGIAADAHNSAGAYDRYVDSHLGCRRKSREECTQH